MMRSATAFLPDSMTTFMNFERSTLPNFGSGRISRLGTSRRRGISFPSLQLAAGTKPAASDDHRLGPPTYSTRVAGHPMFGPQADFSEADPRAGLPVDEALRLLGPLGAVLRTRLLAVLHALQVQRAAHDVIAHAR